MKLTVLRETWRPHPLAWIHRAEARSVAREFVRAGVTRDEQLRLLLDDAAHA